MVEQAPSGVIAIITFPDGHALANAADFDRSGYGGFTLLEAQTIRVKSAVKREAVRRLCHSDVPACLDSYEVERLVDSLISKKGYRLTIIPVNQPDGAPNA